MEEILRELQEMQAEAIRKGIDFDIYTTTYGTQKIEVRLSHFSATPVEQQRALTTTFTPSTSKKVVEKRFDCIKKFIKDIV